MIAAKSLEASAVHIDFDELNKIEAVIRVSHQNCVNQNSVKKV